VPVATGNCDTTTPLADIVSIAELKQPSDAERATLAPLAVCSFDVLRREHVAALWRSWFASLRSCHADITPFTVAALIGQERNARIMLLVLSGAGLVWSWKGDDRGETRAADEDGVLRRAGRLDLDRPPDDGAGSDFVRVALVAIASVVTVLRPVRR
jgi:hypothetical protein